MLEAKRDHDPAEANCILGLIYNFTATRQYDSATVYWNKYHLFKDSVENVAYASQIKQMESLNTIKNYEAQLKQEQEKMALITQKVTSAIKEIGVAGGYVYVMDSTSGIPYISETLSTDVTAQVKQKLGLK